MKNVYLLAALLSPLGLLAKTYQENSPLYFGTYSDDFVIRWGYQNLCHHVYDTWKRWQTTKEGVTFDAGDVNPGDILFVRNLEWFFKNMLNEIEVPFILVSAGDAGQKVSRKKYYTYLSHKNIIHWFAIHPDKNPHPKITPIPLGIFQSKGHYNNREEYSELFAEYRKQPKSHLLYMNFRGVKKGVRAKVFQLFKDEPYCYHPKRTSFRYYFQDLAASKFVLSPRGVAIDCYRTWEALLAGAIPIVEHSQLDTLFEGLPVLIIDNWEDINQEYLERKYEEITSKKYTIEKLFLEYWAAKINAVRDEFLKTHQPLK